MEDSEIVSGNKLISKFMTGIKPEWTPDISYYHDNWQMLMPVVEKITQIEDGKFSVDISSVGMWACFIKRDDVFEKNIVDFGGFEPMIMNVWKSVVGFIQWYNKNKK